MHAQPCLQGSGDAVLLLCIKGAVYCIQCVSVASRRMQLAADCSQKTGSGVVFVILWECLLRMKCCVF
jgi:hypothetical protein